MVQTNRKYPHLSALGEMPSEADTARIFIENEWIISHVGWDAWTINLKADGEVDAQLGESPQFWNVSTYKNAVYLTMYSFVEPICWLRRASGDIWIGQTYKEPRFAVVMFPCGTADRLIQEATAAAIRISERELPEKDADINPIKQEGRKASIG